MAKKVVLFGASSGGQKALKSISVDYKVISIIDNDPHKQGSKIDNIPVVGPDEILKLDYDYICISSCDSYAIKQQLIQYKVPPEKIAILINGIPYSSSEKFSEEEINSSCFPHKINRLKVAIWITSWHCNFSCPYCWEMQRIRNGEFKPGSFIESSKWIEAWNRIKPESIEITGGEPFLQPQFVELLRGINDSIKFSLTTNLSYDITEFVQSIKPERFISITISYHPTSRVNFEFLSDKIKILMQHGFNPITITVVAWREQLYMLEEIKSKTEALGVRFYVNPYYTTQYDPFKYSTDELEYLRQFVEPEIMDSLVLSENKNRIIACNAGAEYITVLPSGEVFRCMNDGLKRFNCLGNLFNNNFTLLNKYSLCHENESCERCDKYRVNKIEIINRTVRSSGSVGEAVKD